ncbi:SipW-dependent-type signal peptide-containing protein [Halobacteriaceae archaeon GCM10025711]
MTDELTNLTRRRVLGSIGAIGAGAALGGAGTMAFFSDDETFTDNAITAGALDLKVDWQQTYNGDPVNAYPDHDGDGVWSLEVEDSVYTDPKSFPDPCGNLDSGDELPDGVFDGPMGSQESLVELTDVKPGDEGEVTFSLHLCDNPGYLWLVGELTENADNSLTEPEKADEDEVDGLASGELADAIRTTIWYDEDCENDLDEGDTVILDDVSLAEAMTVLSDPAGVPLDGVRDGDGESILGPGTCSVESTFDSRHASGDTVTVDGESVEIANNPKCADFGLVEVLKVGPDEDDGELPGVGNSATYQTEYGDIEVAQEGQTVQWRTDSSPDGSFAAGEDGFCISKVVVKGGNEGANVYSYDNDDGDDDFDNDENLERSSGETEAWLQTPTEQDISHVSFCVDLEPVRDGDGRDCFVNSTTQCIGLKWWLPVDHANELQTDSAGFNIGFYAEQCRHNDGSTLPNAGNQDA